MLLNRAFQRDVASSSSPSPNSSPTTYASASKLKTSPSCSNLRPPSPRPTSAKQNSKIPILRPSSPHPSASDAFAKNEEDRSPGSPSPRTPPPRLPSTRPCVPSRTQLRHASAARRLSLDGLSKDILPDEYSLSASPGPAAKEDIFWSGIRSTMSMPERIDDHRPKGKQVKRKEAEPASLPYVKPPPYLRKTMEAAGVGLMADSASMETLMGNKEFLKASFVTPQPVLDEIEHKDNYYHVWVAAKLAMEEMSIKKHGFDEVLKLAFTKYLIELGSALVDCLQPDLPHYTFVDPRRIMHSEGMKSIAEQAVAIVEGLEKKGIKRDRIYVSIPATETGLAIAKDLKQRHEIKTNMVFVSGLTQAAACTAAGAATITMPVDSIFAYHELRRGYDYAELNPHPGRQNIKATACYMKHHKLDTQVIASGLRSLNEIEHCSALSNVCLSDSQVEYAKWHRMRVNRPPGPTSSAMMRATQAPFPPKFTEDERGFRYFSGMSPETRKETAGILHAGLKSWQEGTARIAEVLQREMQEQVDAYLPAPLPPQPLTPKSYLLAQLEYWDQMRRLRDRSLLSWGEPSKSTLSVVFPRTEGGDENEVEVEVQQVQQCEREASLEPPSVPQSPYWQDLETFEDEPGSSSDESSTNDMLCF